MHGGFRSSYRDRVSEETDVQGEVAEASLAHSVKDKTEAAYLRYVIADLKTSGSFQWPEWNESNDFVRQKAFDVAWK